MPEIVPQHRAKRLKRTLSDECLPMSQPELLRNLSEISSTKIIFDTISFSQPLHPEYMIMSQLDCTQVSCHLCPRFFQTGLAIYF